MAFGSQSSCSAPLDCTTPRGRGYIATQGECLKRLSEAWQCQMVETAGDAASDVDALAVRDGVAQAVLEVKSREMTLAQLRGFGSYLITFEKLLGLRTVAEALRVPGFVVVSLLGDSRVVAWQVCDAYGRLLVGLEGKVSATQATCNGGEAHRYNAYLSLTDMNVVI